MTALWLSRLEVAASRVVQMLSALFETLSKPAVLPRLQRALVLLLVLWVALSLWRGVWSFLPEAPPLAAQTVINPAVSATRGSADAVIDIDALAAVRFFGEPGETLSEGELALDSGRTPAMSEEEAAVALAGIEEGAPETRLPLLLRGVVASSEAGLGQAIVEHQKLQDLYQVGDDLPVNNRVKLAKVLPDQVVLDNNGRYEVLRLFEDSDLSAQVPTAAPVAAAAPRRVATERPSRRVEALSEDAPALAAKYRNQLYQDPESLGKLVRISSVRDSEGLRGYRLNPGAAAAEFAALGFEAGDVVTAVNGLSLSNPANSLTLYNAMRSAQTVSIDLERKGEPVTLNVNFGGDGEE